MKNFKSLIVSVVLIVIGIGVMHMFGDTKTSNTAGGGVFVVGLIMLAMSLFSILQKSDKDNNGGHNKK